MKTKHRILSVLTVLAVLASLTAVMVAPVYATAVPSRQFTTYPQLGYVGQVVTITVGGCGLLREQIIRVYYAGVVVPTTPVAPEVAASGHVTALHFAVPASPRGDRTVEVRVGVVKMTPVDTAIPGRDNYFTVRPRVTLSAPRYGPRGATRTATVTGFTAGRSIDVFAGSPDAHLIDTDEIWIVGTVIGSGITDASGGAVVPVTMRDDGRITARDGAGHKSRFNPHSFDFRPGITVTPTSGLPGVIIDVRGTDFGAMFMGTNVTMNIGGIVVAAPPPITTAEDTANEFTRRITIPPGLTPGPKTVRVYAEGQTATAVFTVAPRAFTMTPASGPRGAVVAITGSGFPAGRRGYVEAPDIIERVEFMTTADGAIPAGITATILSGAPAGVQPFTARVRIGVDPTPVVTVTETFTVHAQAITVLPTSGTPGTPVTVTGTGFTPFAHLTLDIGGVPVTPIPPVLADSVGRFTATFVVVGREGPQTVTAAAGPSATAPFTITPAPAIVTVEAGLRVVWPTLGESVWEFRDGVWLQYFIARPELVPAAVRLTRLERGRAYWIFLHAPITNVHIGGTTHTLSAGWHNIGWH